MTRTIGNDGNMRNTCAAVCLVVGFALEGPAAPTQGTWWETTGKNYWSPQSTIAGVIGTDAMNCGHHGPGVTEQSLLKSLACAQDASRGRKAFYTIRSFKGPDERVSESMTTNRWLADGFFGASDGTLYYFDYRGLWLHTLYTVSPPPQPSIAKLACSSPQVIPDPSGTFKFACPK